MKLTLLPSLVLAAICTLSLPNCTQWQLGEVIRGDTEHYRCYSADDEHLDTVYEIKKGSYYAKLPELSYTIEIRNAFFNLGDNDKFTSRHYRSQGKATGGFQWVLITEKQNSKGIPQTTRTITLLPSPPSLAGTTAKKFTKPGGLDLWRLASEPNTFIREDKLLNTCTKGKDETTTWEYIAAAPFDYCIDPALTLVTTPTVLAIGIPIVLIAAPTSMLSTQCQEQRPNHTPALRPLPATETPPQQSNR